MKLHTRIEEQAFEIDIHCSTSRNESERRFRISVKHPDGKLEETEVELLCRTGERWTLLKDQQVFDLMVRTDDEDRVIVEWHNAGCEIDIFNPRDRLLPEGSAASFDAPTVSKAQLPGRVIRVLKKSGDSVRKGEGLLIVEAMKMQNEIKSPRDGTSVQCALREGDDVAAGQVLAEIE